MKKKFQGYITVQTIEISDISGLIFQALEFFSPNKPIIEATMAAHKL